MSVVSEEQLELLNNSIQLLVSLDDCFEREEESKDEREVVVNI